MKTYKIDRIEQVTAKSGTIYHRADLSVPNTEELYTGVAIFSGFDNLSEGAEMEGELTEKEYMGKPSYTLNPPQKAKAGSGGGYKQKLMEEASARKENSIAKFQATKEESIRMAGAQRDAVLLVTTFYKDMEISDTELKEKIVAWRDWLLSDEFGATVPF